MQVLKGSNYCLYQRGAERDSRWLRDLPKSVIKRNSSVLVLRQHPSHCTMPSAILYIATNGNIIFEFTAMLPTKFSRLIIFLPFSVNKKSSQNVLETYYGQDLWSALSMGLLI